MPITRRAVLSLGGTLALGLVTIASAAAAQLSTGHSGWLWGTPTPQGNTLSEVVFDGSTGYAVGQNGTALRSDDGGFTWRALPTDTFWDLSVVQELSPTAVVVGGGCALRESVNGGASFARIPINTSEDTCSSAVKSISFTSPRTGYIELGDGNLLYTSDTGQTVQARVPASLAGGGSGVVFDSPTVGVAFGRTTSGQAEIQRTTDAAATWTVVATLSRRINAVTFVNATTAYAVGESDTVLTSTDGGATWTSRPLSLPAGLGPYDLEHISCSDASHCLISTGHGLEVIRTADGGLTGSVVSTPDGTNDAAFSSASTAAAVGPDGVTAVSTDGGQTFSPAGSSRLEVTSSFTTNVRIEGGAPGHAYVPGFGGRVAATLDGGASWNLMRLPTGARIKDVAFPTASRGYAIGGDGELRTTGDGGSDWRGLAAPVATVPILAAPNAHTVLLFDNRGIRRSVNGGQSFTKVAGRVATGARHTGSKVSKLALRNQRTVAGNVYAWGDRVLVESTSDGATWQQIPLPISHAALQSVSFVTPSTGYVLLRSDRIFATRNRGRSWSEIDSAGVNNLGSISFAARRNGLLLLGNARDLPQNGLFSAVETLRTTDGGKSWEPQVVIGVNSVSAFPPTLVPNAILATPRHDYFVAANLNGDRILSALYSPNGGASPQHSRLSLSIGARRMTGRALARRNHTITVKGRLSPLTDIAERILVSYRSASGLWSYRVVAATASGGFKVKISHISRTTDFIASAVGDGVHGGVGTPAQRLTVTR